MKKSLSQLLDELENDPCLDLWTLQHIDGWKQICEEGALRIRDEHLCYSDLNYAWMRNQMAERIPGYGGGNPVWLWAFPGPGWRTWSHIRLTEDVAYIRCRIPRERVLLSDFGQWETMMAGGIIFPPSADDEEIEAAYEAYDRTYPHPSWQAIFDLRARRYGWRNGGVHGHGLKVQACVETIYRSDILESRILPARMGRKR